MDGLELISINARFLWTNRLVKITLTSYNRDESIQEQFKEYKKYLPFVQSNTINKPVIKDDNLLFKYLRRDQVECILLNEIKKQEPYIEEEKQDLGLDIIPMTPYQIQTTLAHLQINDGMNAQIFMVKLKIDSNKTLLNLQPEESRQKVRTIDLPEDETNFLKKNFICFTQNILNNSQDFDCPVDGCSKTFHKNSKLRQHLKSHLSVRFYKCGYPGCDKSFKMPQHLSYHLTTHNKDKNEKFVCTYPGCKSEFRQKWILRDHEKTHQNVYKFHCEYPGCDKKYNTRSNLEVHLRKHAGVRPFICNFCGKQYISKWNMAKHQRKGCTGQMNLDTTQGPIPPIPQDLAISQLAMSQTMSLSNTVTESQQISQYVVEQTKIEPSVVMTMEQQQLGNSRIDQLLGKRKIGPELSQNQFLNPQKLTSIQEQSLTQQDIQSSQVTQLEQQNAFPLAQRRSHVRKPRKHQPDKQMLLKTELEIQRQINEWVTNKKSKEKQDISYSDAHKRQKIEHEQMGTSTNRSQSKDIQSQIKKLQESFHLQNEQNYLMNLQSAAQQEIVMNDPKFANQQQLQQYHRRLVLRENQIPKPQDISGMDKVVVNKNIKQPTMILVMNNSNEFQNTGLKVNPQFRRISKTPDETHQKSFLMFQNGLNDQKEQPQFEDESSFTVNPPHRRILTKLNVDRFNPNNINTIISQPSRPLQTPLNDLCLTDNQAPLQNDQLSQQNHQSNSQINLSSNISPINNIILPSKQLNLPNAINKPSGFAAMIVADQQQIMKELQNQPPSKNLNLFQAPVIMHKKDYQSKIQEMRLMEQPKENTSEFNPKIQEQLNKQGNLLEVEGQKNASILENSPFTLYDQGLLQMPEQENQPDFQFKNITTNQQQKPQQLMLPKESDQSLKVGVMELSSSKYKYSNGELSKQFSIMNHRKNFGNSSIQRSEIPIQDLKQPIKRLSLGLEQFQRNQHQVHMQNQHYLPSMTQIPMNLNQLYQIPHEVGLGMKMQPQQTYMSKSLQVQPTTQSNKLAHIGQSIQLMTPSGMLLNQEENINQGMIKSLNNFKKVETNQLSASMFANVAHQTETNQVTYQPRIFCGTDLKMNRAKGEVSKDSSNNQKSKVSQEEMRQKILQSIQSAPGHQKMQQNSFQINQHLNKRFQKNLEESKPKGLFTPLMLQNIMQSGQKFQQSSIVQQHQNGIKSLINSNNVQLSRQPFETSFNNQKNGDLSTIYSQNSILKKPLPRMSGNIVMNHLNQAPQTIQRSPSMNLHILQNNSVRLEQVQLQKNSAIYNQANNQITPMGQTISPMGMTFNQGKILQQNNHLDPNNRNNYMQ